jgi:hypothetical protein
MEELTTRAGLPSPKIYENAGCVIVQFCPMVTPPPRQDMEYVTGRQKQILLILDTHREGMAFRQIQAELAGDIPAWEIKNELSALKKIGLATSHGRGRSARWSLA